MIINSKELQKVLENVSKCIKTNSIIPILENVKFTLKDGVLTIVGSDSNTTLSATININCNESIDVCIPAQILNNTLKNIPSQGISITADSNHKVTIKTDKGTFKIQGEPSKDFIRVKEWDSTDSFTIDSPSLNHALSKVLFCASNDDLYPAMIGILLDSTKESLKIVATDGHVLSVNTIDSIGEFKVILQKQPTALLSIAKGNITVNTDLSQICFSFDSDGVEYNLYSRLIDEKYPQYDMAIPKENPISATVNKQELIGSLKRLESFTSITHAVKFDFKSDSLTILAENLDYSNEANESLNCICNQDLTIGFNSKFLMNILNKVSGDEVTFSMSVPNRASLITGSDTAELYLIMPVMVN